MSQIAIRDHNERTSIQSVAFGSGSGGGNLAPQNLGDIVRFAEVMARADIAIPKHLRDNPGACLAVCMQAFKWEMDPFSVAQKSYKVGDQMAYEAQLIAAVINTRAGLKRRPQIEYDGAGTDRVCIVTFEASDGSTHVYQSPRFGSITTKNSPLWKSDPDQQLGYYSVRAGARRHFPEVILGVYDRDEIEGARDVTPAQPERSSFAARIVRPAEAQTPREGFDQNFIDAELGARPEPQTELPETVAEETAPETDAAETGNAIDPDTPAGQLEEPPFDEATQNKLASYTRDLFGRATSDKEPDDRLVDLKKTQERWRIEFASMPEPVKQVAGSIWKSAQAINRGDAGVAAAASFLADAMGVEEAALLPAVTA